MDHAFLTAGTVGGLQIWRIDHKQVVPWDKNLYGRFNYGDAYIVLHSTQKAIGQGFSYTLYFWIGEKSSRNKQAAACFKTVELARFLGNVRHTRQVQGEESRDFLALFRNHRVEYMPGSIAAGRKSPLGPSREEDPLRLLHLKGRKHVRIRQVPLTADSLNQGDIFIMDDVNGGAVYQWTGIYANQKEKALAMEVTVELQSQHGGIKKTPIIFIDERDPCTKFYELLGIPAWARRPRIKDHEAGGLDDDADDTILEIKLYKLNETGDIIDTCIGNLSRTMMDSRHCFVVDDEVELFVWIGKHVPSASRKAAKLVGQELASLREGCLLTKLNEGLETAWFRSKFATWKPVSTPTKPARQRSPLPDMTIPQNMQLERTISQESRLPRTSSLKLSLKAFFFGEKTS
mmetsp:Transcript_11534/g.19622  ORF Transcript_11534/g.19622 Transcript_11534/m.19622 type:complete len:403 (+) Transcript_11534:144-1352(+)